MTLSTQEDQPAVGQRPGIPFTQYLMPNGRRDSVWIERPAAIEAKAQAIIAAGFRFECEMLSDYGTISLTIADPEADEDVAIEVCANGPEVPTAVDRLVTEFVIPSLSRDHQGRCSMSEPSESGYYVDPGDLSADELWGKASWDARGVEPADRAECSECHGSGVVSGVRCSSCLGAGVELTREDFLKDVDDEDGA